METVNRLTAYPATTWTGRRAARHSAGSSPLTRSRAGRATQLALSSVLVGMLLLSTMLTSGWNGGWGAVIDRFQSAPETRSINGSLSADSHADYALQLTAKVAPQRPAAR